MFNFIIFENKKKELKRWKMCFPYLCTGMHWIIVIAFQNERKWLDRCYLYFCTSNWFLLNRQCAHGRNDKKKTAEAPFEIMADIRFKLGWTFLLGPHKKSNVIVLIRLALKVLYFLVSVKSTKSCWQDLNERARISSSIILCYPIIK